MATIPEILEMIIKADADDAKRALNELEAQVDSVRESTDNANKSSAALLSTQGRSSTSLKTLSRNLAGTIAQYVSFGLILRQVASFMVRVNAAAEEENIGFARLQSVIEATGRAAETSARQIDAMVDKLELYSNADKQAAMDAASSLAIMESVPTSLFEQIFDTANDLSRVVGQDIGSAITTIGRAMEEPVEGMTRLRRQGIFITKELQSQISELVEQNRLYDAQKLLLNDIQERVAGTAEKMADAAGMQSLMVALDRYYGSIGQLANSAAQPVTDAAADTVNFFTRFVDQYLDAKRLTEIKPDEYRDMSLGELSEIKDLYDSLADEWPGALGYVLAFEKAYLPVLEEQIALKTEQYELEQKRTEEEKRQEEALKRRAAMLEEEKNTTASVLELYGQTDSGMVEQIQAEIEALQEQYKADQDALLSATDEEIRAQIEQRIPLYDAVIKAKQEELENLTDLNAESGSATESLVSRVLGMSVEDFALSIPLSYDFGRTELETVEEQLSTLKSAINRLWNESPAEDELDEWNEAITILTGRYDELGEKAESLRAKEKESAHQEELKKLAASELASLLTEEEKAKEKLEEYEKSIKELLDSKLITEKEYNELLDRQKETLGLIKEEAGGFEETVEAIGEDFAAMLKRSLSIESAGGRLSSIFKDVGSAIGSGEDAIDAVSDGLGNWIQDLTSQLSTLFVSAGLRLIVEGGLAGLAPGIALMAMGGITGISAGLMGASSSAISEDILQSMQDEMDARAKLADSINESIDTEYDLLKRQLERNLISEETFIGKAGDLQHERDIADARVQISQSLYEGINELNDEYKSMSGWDKFWSGRDEEIKEEIDVLQTLYDSIDTATVDELRSLVDQLKELGLATGSIPKFAQGGEFITSGPQLIMVGDNASGREHVSITPLSSSESPTPQSQTTVIQIQGDVYGWDDLYLKLQQTGMKIERRKRA